MKKLFFILLAVTAFSCSSDDNNPVAVAPIRLQKMEVRDSDGKLIYIVEYSYENNHLSKSTRLDSDGSMDGSTTYSYANDQLIKITDFNNNEEEINVESFVYNDNKIVSTSYLNDNEYYIYNDLGQIIKLQHSQDGTTSDIGNYEYDAAGNLIKYTNVSDNSLSSFTFDNKKTVESLLYPEAVLKTAIFSVPGSNNVIRADFDGGVIYYDYEYEYNAAGYPTKKTQKINGAVSEDITYFYNN